ncbi:MAG: sensor domain-containing diguanylate cyclase [Chromatiales bacterium]|nr:sensor domain-containing diguanylate cyclase [Chromatiales bacterium]
MRLLPEGEYAFLLHRPGIEASIDATQREKYADTNVHPDYLTEHPTISRVTRDFIASPTARALDPLLRQNEEVQSRMAAGETFALPLLHQGRGHVAAFVAIPDVEGRQSAYVVGYSEATAITDLHAAMLRQDALALLLILLLALAIWLTLRRGRLLRESEQRFRHLFDTAPMPLCLVSGDGIIKDANTRFDRLFRYAPLDVRTLAEWWQFACPDPERRQEAVLAWNTALQRARATSSDIEPIEQRVRCRDGCECSMLISGTPIGDETLMTFIDITERREYEQRLERIAHYDPLTGIPNRSLLGDRLHQAVAHARRRGSSMALCYLDLDGFKEINDTHGHATGDDLLVEIARRLKECLREGDTLARLGGDEFVAVLVDLEDFADCERVLRRMLQVVETPVPHANGALRVSVSIGVTLFPGDDADPDTLLRHGDQAMYEAKRAGRNRYHLFDPAREGLNPSHPGAADGGRPIKPIEE